MRTINNLVVHCTATPQTATVASMQNYWRNNLKWRSPGYHIVIDAEGKLHRLQEDKDPTNGVAGHNANSLHVSYIGGVDSKNKPIDNRTEAQKLSLMVVLKYWRRLYPNARILGHRDFPRVAKACPSFDAIKEYQNILP